MIDSRQNYRAPLSEIVIGVLQVGHERVPVQIREESAGGLSLIAQRLVELPIDGFGEVRFGDGRTVVGRIRHCEVDPEGLRIGLQREEVNQRNDVDLRNAFPLPNPSSNHAILYGTALIFGLIFGLVVQSGIARQLLKQVLAAAASVR